VKLINIEAITGTETKSMNPRKWFGLRKNVFVFQHVDCEGPGVFARPDALLKVFRPAEDIPSGPDMASASGLVVLGGPMAVYESDQHPWIAREVDLVRGAVRDGKPVLGICLGSQILAAALGSRVYRHDCQEIGWDDITLAPGAEQDPLLSGLPSPLKVFHWHGDTFDLPAGAVHLASSRLCRNQAFRFGDKAWGFQCHFEIDRNDPKNWAGVYREQSIDKLERETGLYWQALQPYAEKIARRFFAFCAGA
jgi:GMP synthase (glutamine-hydrolysing)